MKRLNLIKYGFYRIPNADFFDDGSKFTCYGLSGANRIRLSKTSWAGDVFLSARIEGKLDYKDYSNLEHYIAVDRLNGVSMESLTDADLVKLAQDCIAYQKEYEEAEKLK